MTIRFKVGRNADNPPEQTIEVSSFGEFRDWLHGLGAGREVTDREILASWAKLYRKLQEPGFPGATIGLQRATFGSSVTVLGVAPPRGLEPHPAGAGPLPIVLGDTRAAGGRISE